MIIQVSRNYFFPRFLTLTLAFICMAFFAQAQDADKSAASLYNEGLAMLKAKDYVGGLPMLEAALEKATEEENEKVIELSKKNGAIAAYNVGNAQMKEKKYAEAEATFRKGIELNDKYASNYTGVANVLNKSDKKIEAVDYYLQGIAVATENGKAKKAAKSYKKLNSIIGKMYTSKDFDTTIAQGKRVLEVGSTASIHYYVARAMLEKGMNEEALVQANKAVSVATEKGAMQDKYYFAVGKANAALDKKDDAIKAFQLIQGEKYKKQAEYQITQLKG